MAGESAELNSPVRRAVSLLRVLIDEGSDMTVQAFARRLDLAPSTVHRLLTLLEAEGLVAKNPRLRRYGVGGELYRLAARVRGRAEVIPLAAPVMAALTESTNEACLLAWYIPPKQRFSFVAAQEGPSPLVYRVELNASLSLLWGAAGKCVLAHLPRETFDAIMTEARSIDGPAIDERELHQQLQSVRDDGYLVTRSERLPGAIGIASPVFGADDDVVGALCIVLPEARFPKRIPGDIGLRVRDSARQLSHLLGSSRPSRSAAPS